MLQKEKDFCFCTLALGSKYCLLAKQLADDLAKYSPQTSLVIYTDQPNHFSSHPNVLAFKHHQQGLLLCYHDKRFVIEKALSQFRVAISIDADTRILASLSDFDWPPGITAGHQENLIEHVEKYTPERLEHLKKVALKLNIPLKNTTYIGESLFIVAKDEGREIEFIKQWGIIASYLELKGVHAGSGNAIGLAAVKVGWTIQSDGWKNIKQVSQHLDASHKRKQKGFWERWKRRLGYHYRINRARLMALKDFDFYYK